MEALKKHSMEANQRYAEKIQEREGIDNPWMLQLLKKVHDGQQVSNEEVLRVWEIFGAEKNHKIEDKIVAFRLIAEIEDISKWEKEFDAFAYSEDPKFVKTAIQTILWKLDQGTEREKIILSNKTVVLNRLIQFAEDNKSDTTIDARTSQLIELTKTYSGKTPPAEIQRPRRRPSESPTGVAHRSNETNPNSSIRSWVKKTGANGSLILGGFIGILIITGILICRRKSKSTS